MSRSIFTYGSLMFPAVWQRVAYGSYRATAALLEDHARYAIVGASYPGMVAQTGASVEGVLYFDVCAEDLARLDAFEGTEYRRAAVQVRSSDGERRVAETYLYRFPHCLEAALWEANAFDVQNFLRAHDPAR